MTDFTTMPLVRPRAVSPGDTVAVVSSSWGGAGLLAERFHRGVQALESLGYEVTGSCRTPSGPATECGNRSPREERLQDLHAAFEDPEVTCVLSAIGRDHSAQLLEGIDFETHPLQPKGLLWLLGHHDASGRSRTNRPRYLLRSALLPEFGEIGGPDREVVEHFQLVAGRAAPPGAVPSVPWQAVEDRAATDVERRPRARRGGEVRIALRPGRASGGLQVGCLPTCRALIGTPWQPEYRSRILVVEEAAVS